MEDDFLQGKFGHNNYINQSITFISGRAHIKEK